MNRRLAEAGGGAKRSNWRRGLAAGGVALAGVIVWTSRAAASPGLDRGGDDSGGRATLDAMIHWVTRAAEVAGVGVLVFGAIGATVVFLLALWRKVAFSDAYHHYRSSLGRAILLGLEFLVAADIINTVAVEPTLRSVLVLGLVVLIRTFLSFSLEVEIEGKWPWQASAQKQSQERRVQSAAGV